MGYKTKTSITKIERQKVYIVYKWPHLYGGEKEIIRCFTSLEKAKNWIDKFTEDMKMENMAYEVVKERKGKLFQGTKEQFYKEVYYYKDEWRLEDYIIRMCVHELDADYDEQVWVEYNPK